VAAAEPVTGGLRSSERDHPVAAHSGTLVRMPHAVSHPTLELLTWIAARPRTYAEAIDAWRTSCPRHAVWEDALADGLVQVVDGRVILTARGTTVLA
jgi:hypothetical protein